MAKRIHINAVAGQVRDLAQAASGAGGALASLGLVTISQGRLTSLPAPQNLAGVLPALLVVPGSLRMTGEASDQLRQTLPLHCLLLNPFAAGEEVDREATADLETLADWLLDQRDLGGLVLANTEIEDTLVTTVSAEAATDIGRFFQQLHLDATVGEIVFEVELTTLRR